MAKATFGAGCFWGIELTFQNIEGVSQAVSGYSGGNKGNPTYEKICTSETGHAEVVEVTYEPSKVSYDELLAVFWGNHNPTTLNSQGPDFGTQYRSVIFYHDDTQKQLAEKSKGDLEKSGRFKNSIVTFIEPAQTFYMAEEYHQKYLEKRGQNVCHI
jgi:peptide-methionine (S)-S-oxide reductase